MLLVDSFGVHPSRTPGALEPYIYPLLANRVPWHGVVGKNHGSCRLTAHQPGIDGFMMAFDVKNVRCLNHAKARMRDRSVLRFREDSTNRIRLEKGQKESNSH